MICNLFNFSLISEEDYKILIDEYNSIKYNN